MKVVHTSDLHLGRQRLGGRLPNTDLADAFEHIATTAIAEHADAFLLAGDLFDRAQVHPQHLLQAERVLKKLHAANIPVLAIEGNHDRATVHQVEFNWIHYLAEQNLLIHLAPRFDADGAHLPPWDPATRTGATHDLHGFRFVGAGYLGAATPAKVRQLTDALEPGIPHVLLLHAGPENFVGEGGGFAPDDLERLRQRLAYLALGHVHTPMLHGTPPWACNPGSPEHCTLHEVTFPEPRGYAVVRLHPDAPPAIDLRSNPRRPVVRLHLDCTPFGTKTRGGLTALHRAATDLIRAKRPPADAVVDLHLHGRLHLGRIPLNPDDTAAHLLAETNVFHIHLNLAGLNDADPETDATAATPDPKLQREDLERLAILEAVRTTDTLALDDPAAFADLFHNLKEMVRDARPDEHILETLLASPLTARVQDAQHAATLPEPESKPLHPKPSP